MDKEPSKGARMRACEMHGVNISEFEQWWATGQFAHFNDTYRAVEVTARFIDHVSEVAKANAPHLQRACEMSIAYGDRGSDGWAAASRVRDNNNALILPDPEPDVLEEAWIAAWPDHPRPFARRHTAKLTAELAKRGGRIVFDGVQP